MRTTALTLAATAVLCGAALAQDTAYQPEAPEAAPLPTSVEDSFRLMDLDASGTVDEAEFVTYAGEGSEGQFAEAAGEDGLLTQEELEAYVTQRGEDDAEAPASGDPAVED